MWYKKRAERGANVNVTGTFGVTRPRQPLRQMGERGVNMVDVRERLGVKSVAWKVEERVLERMGHVLRMEKVDESNGARVV